MVHHPDAEPFHRRQRFDFDKFDSEITEALKKNLELRTQPDTELEVERSLGRAMIDGHMTAEQAMENLDAYEKNLQPPSEPLS